jgi:DNA-binding GntR family transcriptional regulator
MTLELIKKTEPKNTRASDQAYRVIKREILEGKLKPGEKLGKRSMAALCSVSIIPVIDALNRLENEGFVESTPYGSSRVVNFDGRLADLYILREAIEVQIVRILCFTIGSEEAEKLRSLAIKIDSMAGQSDKTPDYDDLHYQFHIRLAKATGSKNLLDEIENIHIFSLLAKAEILYTTLGNSVPSNEYSHEDIIMAILKRNPEDAERIIRRHIYRSKIIQAPYWI